MDVVSYPQSNAIYLVDGCNVISKKYPSYDDYYNLIRGIANWIYCKSRRSGRRPQVVVFFDSGARGFWNDYLELIDVKIQHDENSNADTLLLDFLDSLPVKKSQSNIYVVSSDKKDICSKIKQENVEIVSKERFLRSLENAGEKLSVLQENEGIKRKLKEIYIEEKNKNFSSLIPTHAKNFTVLGKNRMLLRCETFSIEFKSSLKHLENRIKPQYLFLVFQIDVTNDCESAGGFIRGYSIFLKDRSGNTFEPTDSSVHSAAKYEYQLAGIDDEIKSGETKRLVAVFDIPPESVEDFDLKVHDIEAEVKEITKKANALMDLIKAKLQSVNEKYFKKP